MVSLVGEILQKRGWIQVETPRGTLFRSPWTFALLDLQTAVTTQSLQANAWGDE